MRERIARAEEAAGRPEGSVRLVAVTKGHPLEAVRAALDAGLRDLGENRVGEMESKQAQVASEEVTWHMIGHLQRRKAGRALAAADLIHSVDSDRLADRLGRLATEAGTVAEVLVQVNVSGEASKEGFCGPEAAEAVAAVAAVPGLRVRGLMTMAPFVDDARVLSDTFAGLRRVLEEARAADVRVGDELSMGMTNDLDIAIREGSTMVRIGTALFGPRPP